eukprot:8645120-Pyramimonas_sp.AAC.1
MESGKKGSISFSRLDRAYTSISAGLLLDLDPSSGTVGRASDVAQLPDHMPASVSSAPPGKSGIRSALPWVATRRMFPWVLQGNHRQRRRWIRGSDRAGGG